MIFECADCTCDGVVAVGIWGKNLEVDVVLAECFLYGNGALVIKDVESGGVTMMLEVFMERLPGFSDLQRLQFLRSWVWIELVS